ncbi:hypothetical protein GC163_01715 [bacterium]|nr:hypothetical protein [bacterium]
MNPIPKILFEIWNGIIRDEYSNMRINSEGKLEALLFARLESRLLDTGIEILVQPKIQVDGDSFIPDLMLCRDLEVIAVLEAKYLPKVGPKAKRDIKKLKSIATTRPDPLYVLQRYRGSASTHALKFRLSDMPIFVWLGLYNPEMRKLKVPFFKTDDVECLSGEFVELHAMTKESDAPDIRKWINGIEQID